MKNNIRDLYRRFEVRPSDAINNKVLVKIFLVLGNKPARSPRQINNKGPCLMVYQPIITQCSFGEPVDLAGPDKGQTGFRFKVKIVVKRVFSGKGYLK